MMLQPTLLKVGGAELAPGEALDKLVGVIARISRDKRLIIVHGGGPEIAHWQKKVGLEPKIVDGLRVTDEASLQVAEMVLSGLVNKRLVGKLVAAGVQAVGLSGVDAGLLVATRMQASSGSLGLVGEISEVNTGLLNHLLDAGYVPVISPISTGKTDLTLNVNADHAALAIARAVKAAEALFLTNVPGVLDDGRLRPSLTSGSAQEMIRSGVINGGMVPKVRSALDALAEGVQRVLITNLDGLVAGTGTWVQTDSTEAK